ncbi:MAG: thioredoxin domain-containing protein, partial [Actinomycetota bacterium]|nr:thioredoxin domain-containing protein [Actinomycetota bacterium]
TAARNLRQSFEPTFGGWGRAPKFPNAPALEFLLRRAYEESDEDALAMATKTLDGMALGGMYDLLGGGFHRYSVDERWLVPHFEKMLYDNALLAPAYLHAWLVTGNERYRRVCEETVAYMLRELALEHGGFASAQDADTEGVEGLTFTWTEAEGAPAEMLEPFEHGRSILRGELEPELRRRLFEQREQRPKPLRDDKAIASWNGLALAALAEAGRRLERPEWVDAARRVGEFLLGPLSDAGGRLLRSHREGRTSGSGFLDDYANAAHGLYELHVATGELRWLDEAIRLARLAVELFADDERGGFFLADRFREPLVASSKPLDDHPMPSGNSMLAHVLLRLARIYGDDELERRAVSVFRLVRPALERAPSAFGWALCALRLHFSSPRELAIVGGVDTELARAALAPWQPESVVAVGPADGVPLLAGKGLVDGKPAVYVCERFVCRAPVTDPAALEPA